VNAVALTNQATRALEQGDYARAEQLARQAVAALQGTGELYEAYAEYDLGAALVGLGRCDEALPHLDRSESLQGKRKEIDRARRACKKRGRGQGDDD
jgi:tetratricopeptide (TPR) repeat protein